MSIQYCYKKTLYEISNRTYLDDYSHIKSKKIDMTLSGRYLYRYPFNKIDKYELDRYPNDKEVSILKENIINKYNIDKSKSIILGSGTNGLIQNIVKILFSNNIGNLVTSFLTFNQVEYAVTSFGSKTKRVYLDNYKINLDNFTEAIDENTKLIYICNPNNPTGNLIQNEAIIEFANKNNKVPIVIDESNLEFSTNKSLLYEKLPDNLIILKSFSKAYGLANLRIGYMVCSKELEKIYLRNVTVNEFSGLSCILANKVINSNKYLKNVELIKKQREYLSKELKKLDIDIIKSSSNTIMTKTTFDKKFLEQLEKSDISIVPILDENKELHIRIAIQDKKTNKKFIKVLKNILK